MAQVKMELLCQYPSTVRGCGLLTYVGAWIHSIHSSIHRATHSYLVWESSRLKLLHETEEVVRLKYLGREAVLVVKPTRLCNTTTGKPVVMYNLPTTGITASGRVGETGKNSGAHTCTQQKCLTKTFVT